MERRQLRAWIIVLGLLPLPIPAQTTLPDVNVTAPKWEERHGGYLISGNFDVDPKTPSAHSASPRKRKIASGSRTKANSSCGCSAFR